MAKDYRLQHRPGNPLKYPDEVATADKISSGEFFPKDFLVNTRDYLTLDNHGGRESLQVLRSIQGKPNATVTVYRGSPVGELNKGDWVTLSRTYAEQYASGGGYSDNPNSRVYSYKVKASELSFDGDDISEFGYWGESKKYGESGNKKKAQKKASYGGRSNIGSNGG